MNMAEKKKFFLKDAQFRLPQKVCSLEEEESEPHWLNKGSHCWLNGCFAEPINRRTQWPLRVNFSRIFKDKKPSECFLFTVTTVYQFDDESEKTEEMAFEVLCLEGEYVSPFLFW